MAGLLSKAEDIFLSDYQVVCTNNILRQNDKK